MIKYIPEERIKQAAVDTARILSEMEPDIIICVLTGGFMFFSDVIRNMTHFNFEIDFIKATSYIVDGKPSYNIQVSGPFCSTSLRDKKVVIIEDIIDRGDTMIEIVKYLKNFGPKELRVETLLIRSTAKFPEDYRPSGVTMRYSIMVHDDNWLVGYGLDQNGHKRTFSNIYKIENGITEKS